MKKALVVVLVLVGIIVVLFAVTKIHFGRGEEKGKAMTLEELQKTEADILKSYAELGQAYPDWETMDFAADPMVKIKYDSVVFYLTPHQSYVELYNDLFDPDYVTPENIQNIIDRLQSR